MSKLIHAYRRILHAYPIIVQSVQTSLLMALGDICAQTIIEDKNLKQLDLIRTARFGSLGMILVVSI